VARDPSKPAGWYCDATRHEPECPKTGCPGCLEPCSQRAGWGTSHPRSGACKRHGGATKAAKTAADREQARQACALFGLDGGDIDPAEALLGEVTRTHRAIVFYEGEIALLPKDEQGVWRLYRNTRHASGELTGEAKPHVLVGLWMAERKHLAEVTAKALHAGVAQRTLDMQQEIAGEMLGVLRRFVEAMGLDPADEVVRRAGRAALQLAPGRDAA